MSTNLTQHLDSGRMAWEYEKPLSSLFSMSIQNQVRHGYLDRETGEFTPRGVNRLTSDDWKAYDRAD